MSTHAFLQLADEPHKVRYVHYDGDSAGEEIWKTVGKIGYIPAVDILFAPIGGGWSFLCADNERLAKAKVYNDQARLEPVGIRYQDGQQPYGDPEEAQYAEWTYILDQDGMEIYHYGHRVGKTKWNTKKYNPGIKRLY